jgi:hypothetical protein
MTGPTGGIVVPAEADEPVEAVVERFLALEEE